MSGGEDELVAWLRRRLPGRDLLGDDTARFVARGALAATVDQQIEGVHFPSGLDPGVVARRLLAVNLSDLAAAGARPRWALCAIAAPPAFAHRRFFTALLAACAEQGVTLAGGDLARSPTLALSLTLLGEHRAGARPLTRRRARPGQRIRLGGPVGESALGRELLVRGARLLRGRVHLPRSLDLPRRLRAAARRAVARHLAPDPQLALGAALARAGGAGAVIDLSDGLARDLGRVCEASGVGARLDLPSLRRALAPDFEALCAALELSPLGLALGGGEDYVLLFTLPRRAPARLRALGMEIGGIEPGGKLEMRDAEGRLHPLPELGWDHLRPSAGQAFD